MELNNPETSQKGGVKMELVLKCDLSVSKQSIKERAASLGISWINPRVDDEDYPFLDSFAGKWSVEVLRLQKKMKIEDIVRRTKKDGWQPASVHHLLALLSSEDGKNLSGSLMAPGSLCIDDFEYPGCVVLSINGSDKKLGLGNWRGSKIGGHDVVRVKRKQNSSTSDDVD
jgi:hypothetical protein